MPNYKSAKRALKKNERNRRATKRRRGPVKALKKELTTAIREKRPEAELMDLYTKVTKALDKAAGKRAVPRNTAARYKSRLIRAIRKIHGGAE